jgi:aldose 1-epimerase
MMSNIVHRIGPDDGLQITVAERGAAWLSCRVPLPDGTRREVLLGHASAADYAHQPGFLGAVVGRYANRMGGARFSLDGVQHHLLANEGASQLHGGPDGFDRRNWTLQELGPLALRLQLHSPAGDQGYPGNLEASVTYRIDAAALAVTLQFEAGVDQPCPVNLAGHAYFNLDARHHDVLAHRLRVAASTMLPVDVTMIPLGQLAPVADTAFDLRQGRAIGESLGQGEQQALARGYDHCFALDAAAASGRVACRRADGLRRQPVDAFVHQLPGPASLQRQPRAASARARRAALRAARRRGPGSPVLSQRTQPPRLVSPGLPAAARRTPAALAAATLPWPVTPGVARDPCSVAGRVLSARTGSPPAEQSGQAELVLQVGQQVHHLRLHQDVAAARVHQGAGGGGARSCDRPNRAVRDLACGA